MSVRQTLRLGEHRPDCLSGSLNFFVTGRALYAPCEQNMEREMNVTLHGKTYAVVRDEDGFPMVIVHRRGRIWDVASPATTLVVLAGLTLTPFR